MPTLTLAQLRTKVRDPDFTSSTVFTTTLANRYINEALAELYDLVSDQFQGQYDKTATAVTVAGTQTVALPSDFYDLRALDWQRDTAGERFTPMRRLNLIQTYSYEGRGTPAGYMLSGGTAPGTIRLWPIPDGVYTLRVTYEPLIAQLSSDSDSFDFRNGWEEYVVQSARLRFDIDEERGPSDRLLMIDRAAKRIVGSAGKRNSAEPDYLQSWPEGSELL